MAFRGGPELVVTHGGPIRAIRVLGHSTTWDEAMSEAVPYAAEQVNLQNAERIRVLLGT